MTGPSADPGGRAAPARGLLLVLIGVGVGAAVLSYGPKLSSSPAGPSSAPVTTPPSTPASSSTTTSTTLAAHQPSQVKVLVANGTNTSGLGGKLASRLTNSGYDVLSPTNTTSTASASAVYYAAGYLGDAQAVARASGIGNGAIQAMTGTLPVSDTKGAVLLVVIGPDIASSLASG